MGIFSLKCSGNEKKSKSITAFFFLMLSVASEVKKSSEKKSLNPSFW